ncbi:hypothetical protein N7495_000746 [Penicillium taxi]|uniref:uncharacterized protein n=1 Tax=Penicillium taxi TaxID=168475 RepID=UPI0025456E6A|nr:uncharacterized protein N7495_000746 [Penicillium taxi]KAJ5908064.1 hypothetical protein N7495_000746 [Penicillium taxi]
MENNTNWNVNIKIQLQAFALAVRAFKGTTEKPSSPDLDMIWLGHCGIDCKADLPFYQTPNDPTTPELRHSHPYWRGAPPIERPDYTWLTCTIGDSVCLSMYAVSYHRVQQILNARTVSESFCSR